MGLSLSLFQSGVLSLHRCAIRRQCRVFPARRGPGSDDLPTNRFPWLHQGDKNMEQLLHKTKNVTQESILKRLSWAVRVP